MNAPATPSCFLCADTGVASRIPVGPREHRSYELVACTCAKGRVFAAASREVHNLPAVPNVTTSEALSAAPPALDGGPVVGGVRGAGAVPSPYLPEGE
jgi:hypothetical protein